MEAIWRRRLVCLKKEGTEGAMEDVDAPDAHRPERVSVIGVIERKKPLLPFDPFMPPVLKCHLEGDLNRR
jgi:hypothetical protein